MKRGEHDENCIKKHPDCLCNRCANDHGLEDSREQCCLGQLGGCGVSVCINFQEDEKAQTNGDRLRAMNDEELSAFMFKMGWTLNNYHHAERCASCRWDSCEACLEDWMKEEAKT